MICRQNSTQRSRRVTKQFALFTIAFMIVLIGGTMHLPQMKYGQNMAAAFTTAQLDLASQVSVQADNSNVQVNDPGTTGDFTVTADFSVESNANLISMFVEATDFYFNADPTGQQIEPVHLGDSAGVEIDPQGASPLNGRVASYDGVGDSIDGYPSRKTVEISFKTNSSDNMFRHPVAVTVTWNLDRMRPAGRYMAKINLTCIAIPDY